VVCSLRENEDGIIIIIIISRDDNVNRGSGWYQQVSMIILHPFRTRKEHRRNQTHFAISVAAISILYLSATTVSSLLFAKTTTITAFRCCGAKTRSVYRFSSSRSSSVSDMFQTNKNVTTNRTSSNTTTTSFTVGNRIEQTAEPCVILMKQITSQYADLWKDKGGIYSLAQVCLLLQNIEFLLLLKS